MHAMLLPYAYHFFIFLRWHNGRERERERDAAHPYTHTTMTSRGTGISIENVYTCTSNTFGDIFLMGLLKLLYNGAAIV